METRSRTSRKKGPGRVHYEPIDARARHDKREKPRQVTGAKSFRKAVNKTLTKNH